ncbi:Phytochrome-like protein cph2 [bioreactor metagenome]|uniref:Phytochrome-like protein cph2 n=1 Tax=bioreactor metagenome TaxID=1076179 RepID=A0A645JAV9_9ZZZZ
MNAILQTLATTDALTGLANRRSLFEMGEKECRRAQRQTQPLSLLIVDIDHFKEYNDHFGHAAGDHCLTKIAGGLEKTLNRAGDLVARYGGEEFVAILPDTDEYGAREVAERFLKAIEALALPNPLSNVADRVTISIGFASVTPRNGHGANDLLEQADKRLYQAKALGKNRIVGPGDDQASE